MKTLPPRCMRRFPARYWRVKGDGNVPFRKGSHPHFPDGNAPNARRLFGDFDELVVGDWIHLERMDHRAWWMCIGDTHFWITIPADPAKPVLVGLQEGTVMVDGKEVRL